MNKINFKNLPNETTPVNATNLNTMQDNIEAEIDEINACADTRISLYAKGWYRIAKAENTNVATACIIKLGTTYSNQMPMTAMLSITTSYDTASINLLSGKLKGTNIHFSKARIQYDSTNKVHYLDIYYEEENLNNWMYTNLIAKDGFWNFTENTTVTEYTTICEISTTGITTGTEFKTGRIIDGKEEYGKVIKLSSLPDTSTTEISLGLSGVTYTDYFGVAVLGGDAYKMETKQSDNYSIKLDVRSNKARVTTYNSSYVSCVAHIEVHYLKNS